MNCQGLFTLYYVSVAIQVNGSIFFTKYFCGLIFNLIPHSSCEEDKGPQVTSHCIYVWIQYIESHCLRPLYLASNYCNCSKLQAVGGSTTYEMTIIHKQASYWDICLLISHSPAVTPQTSVPLGHIVQSPPEQDSLITPQTSSFALAGVQHE